jgi:hypothetical protein
MKTTVSVMGGSSMWRRNSLLFWCTLVVPVAIIAIGINFILNPVGASAGFSIPIHDPVVSHVCADLIANARIEL